MMNTTQKDLKNRVPLINSLQTRLIVFFLTIALVPLGIVTTLAISRSQQITQSQIESDQKELVTTEKGMIVDWLNNLKGNLDTVVAFDNGQMGNQEQLQANVVEFKKSWGIYESVIIINAKGIDIADATGKPGIDLSAREYFKQAMSGEFYFSNALISKQTGNVVVVAAEPIKVDGKIVAVAGIVCPITAITDVLKSSQTSHTDEAYLIDSNGVFITPSRFIDRLMSEKLVTKAAEAELKIDTFGAQEVIKGVTGVSQYKNYLGDQVLGAYTPIGTAPWELIVEQNSSEVFLKTSSNINRRCFCTVPIG